MFICMFQNEGQHYIYSNKVGEISAFQTLDEGLHHFTGDYDTLHRRSVTWSTGATLHWLHYKPKIIQLETIEELKDRVVRVPGAKVHSIFSGMWGQMTGISCGGDAAKELYEGGVSVDPISKEFTQHP